MKCFSNGNGKVFYSLRSQSCWKMRLLRDFSNTVCSFNWSFWSIKNVIFGIFQLHSISRWATHSEIWTLGCSENILSLEHLGLQILSSGEHQAARVKNPRLCNPIKVTGFISPPDLTFSALEDFMTLPMPSFYYLAAIMNVMHNIFFRWFFSNREFHWEL